MDKNTSFQAAVTHVGGQVHMAKALTEIVGKHVRQSHVWNWLKAGRVPAEYAIPVERATGGRVSRHELRPDIYPVDEVA